MDDINVVGLPFTKLILTVFNYKPLKLKTNKCIYAYTSPMVMMRYSTKQIVVVQYDNLLSSIRQ